MKKVAVIFFVMLHMLAYAQERQVLRLHEDKILCNNFLGIGVQWSAYPHADAEDAEWGLLMTDEKWNTLYHRLDHMQPRFMRVVDQANWRYFKGTGNDGKPILDFNCQEVKSLCKIFDYCQKNNITVMIGDYGVPGLDHDKENKNIRLRGTDDPRFIKMIGDWVDFLLNTKRYTCIRYYDFINEPNGDWSNTRGNFAEWALGIKLLHQEFVRRGLDKKIIIAGPGSVPNYTYSPVKFKYDGSKWIEYTSEVLNTEIGAYNTHAYFRHPIVREGKVAEYVHLKNDAMIADKDKKPFFLGEIGIKASDTAHERKRLEDGHASTDCNMHVYDYFYGIDIASAAIQSLLAGVDGMAVWDLDDAMHTQGDSGDKNKLKRWGFWNILGTELYNDPKDENIRPWYYAWSWLCKFMPVNTVLYEADQPGNAGAQVLFAKSGEHYTIYMVNTSEKEEKFYLQSSLNTPLELNQLIYNEQYADRELPYKAGKIRKADLKNGLPVDLPPKTFMVLTTMQFN